MASRSSKHPRPLPGEGRLNDILQDAFEFHVPWTGKPREIAAILEKARKELDRPIAALQTSRLSTKGWLNVIRLLERPVLEIRSTLTMVEREAVRTLPLRKPRRPRAAANRPAPVSQPSRTA